MEKAQTPPRRTLREPSAHRFKVWKKRKGLRRMGGRRRFEGFVRLEWKEKKVFAMRFFKTGKMREKKGKSQISLLYRV